MIKQNVLKWAAVGLYMAVQRKKSGNGPVK